MPFLEGLGPESLLTFGGFVAYLIWHNKSLSDRYDKLLERHIEHLGKSSGDLMEATRLFDGLVREIKK